MLAVERLLKSSPAESPAINWFKPSRVQAISCPPIGPAWFRTAHSRPRPANRVGGGIGSGTCSSRGSADLRLQRGRDHVGQEVSREHTRRAFPRSAVASRWPQLGSGFRACVRRPGDPRGHDHQGRAIPPFSGLDAGGGPVALVFHTQDVELHVFVPKRFLEGVPLHVDSNGASQFGEKGLERVLIPSGGREDSHFVPSAVG